MSDREQLWSIVANFSSLTKEAQKAARAIRQLDKARSEANQNSKQDIVDVQGFDRQEQALNKLSTAMRDASRERGIYNKSIGRSTSTHTREANSLDRLSQAHGRNSSAISSSTSAHVRSTAQMGRSGSAARSATSSIRRLGQQTSVLGRLFESTGGSSRSWALALKMLPLTAVTSGINSLVPAINGLGGAFVGLAATITPVFGLLGALPSALTAAAGGIGGVLAGMTGIAGAFKAFTNMEKAQSKESSKAAGSSGKAREKAIKSAQKAVDRARKAQEDAAKGIIKAEERIADVAEDNAERIAEAEDQVAEAQARAKEAQADVNKAREEAARALQDYRSQLRGVVLDEESASIALSEARAKLAATMMDPNATNLERQAADLAVRQAELQLEETAKAARDLEKEAAEADRNGIEGSDQVVDAKGRQADANKDLADAQKDLAKAHKDSDRAMRDALEGLDDAKDAYADAVAGVADAQEALASAGNDVGGATSAAATKANEYAEALAKLPPAAREVVKELITLRDAWQDVSYSAAEAMSPGMLEFLRTLRTSLLPTISDFLVKMAGGAGEFARSLGQLLGSDRVFTNLTATLDDAYNFMGYMGRAVLNLTDLFFGLGAAAKKSGLTEWVGSVIEGWTEGWKSNVDTPKGITNTANGMRSAIYFAELWGDTLRSVWTFMRKFLRGFRPLGEWVVRNIQETTQAWADWLDTDDGADKLRTWQALAMINLTGLSNMIRTITDQGRKLFDGIDFQRVWDSINGDGSESKGLINALGDLLGIVSEDMIVNVINLGTALLGVLQTIGESWAMSAVIGFVDVLGRLLGVVDGLLKSVPLLGNAVVILMGAFASKKMIEAVGALTGLSPVFDAVKSASAKGYTKGNGLGKAAFKEYMNYGAFVPEVGSGAAGGSATSAIVAGSSKTAAADAKAAKKQYRRDLKTWKQYQKEFGADSRVAKAAGRKAGASSAAFMDLKGTKGGASALGKLAKAGGAAAVALMGLQLAGAAWNTTASAGQGAADRFGAALNNLTAGNGDFDSLMTKSGRSFSETMNEMKPATDAWNVTIKTVWHSLQKLSTGLTGVQTPITDMVSDFEQLDQGLSNLPLDQAADQFKKVSDMAREQGWATEDLIAVFPSYSSAVNEAIIANGGAALSGDALRKAMEGASPVVADLKKQMADDRSEQIQREAIDKVTTEYEEAKQAVDDLNQAQRDAAERWMSEQEATDTYLDTLGELNTQLKDNGNTLNQNTADGRANRSWLRDLASDARSVTDAMIDNGSSVQVVNDKMTEMRDEFIKTVGSFGIVGTAAETLADDMGLIPNYVETSVLLRNANLTETQIASIEEGLVGLPPDIQTEIQLIALTEGYDEAMALIKTIPTNKDISVDISVGEVAYKSVHQAWIDYRAGEKNRASGGSVFGKGTSTSDSIPVMLSNGEYVVKAASARKMGRGVLDYINRTGQTPNGYATGGSVSAPSFSNPGGKIAKLQGAVDAGIAAIVTSQLQGLQNSLASVGQYLSSWGNSLVNWWSGVWSTASTVLSGAMLRIKAQVGVPWTAIWTGMYTTSLTNLSKISIAMAIYSGSIVRAVSSMVLPMRNAWTAVLDTVKTPVRNAVSYVNTTLGTMVNKVVGFYGGAKSPFPISVPGFSSGGWTGPGSKYQPAGLVHADEFVINKKSRRNIEKNAPGLLDQMNRTGKAPGYATGGRVRPVRNGGRISGSYKGHSGIDFPAPTGTPVMAAMDGTILRTKKLSTSFGWHIVQRLADGLNAVYGHLSAIGVSAGSSVRAGQTIGRVGNTGRSYGSHLHFEVSRGSFGHASNRPFTFSWLRGATAGTPGPMANVPGVASSTADSPLSNISHMAMSAVANIKSSMSTWKSTIAKSSEWSKAVSSVVGSLGNTVTTKLSAGFARGGWTGPGGKNTPAGIVHADEYVINKNSRQRIERTAPGILDYLNAHGTLPGYASGGAVGAVKPFTIPRTLKNLKLLFNYARVAESWDATHAISKRRTDTLPHIQMLENLLAHEGLLWRKNVNGFWDKSDIAAWKAWQTRSGLTASGKVNRDSLKALASKYKVPYDLSTPYVPGLVQPRPEDVMLATLSRSNAEMTKFLGLINQLKAKGFSYTYDSLKALGPSGIPDEYRDSENPIKGMGLATSLLGNLKTAKAYEAALKAAAKFGDSETSTKSGINGKMQELLDLLTSGTEGPYGLQGAASELGVSIDTTVQLFRKLNKNGSLKSISASRLSRIRGDIADFDNLFKFANGGIVPGVGNKDSVLSLLTPGELVIPKDVVSQLLRASSAPPTSFADFSAGRGTRRVDTVGATGKVFNFNTTVNNPVAEAPSSSIQKRVRSAASLGLFGG